MWVIAVIAYPPLMGAACIAALVRASRQGQALAIARLPFRVSIGDQAERWLHAQCEPFER